VSERSSATAGGQPNKSTRSAPSFLTRSEFMAALGYGAGQPPSKFLERIFFLFDANRDGVV
jgi:hypothetical protein